MKKPYLIVFLLCTKFLISESQVKSLLNQLRDPNHVVASTDRLILMASDPATRSEIVSELGEKLRDTSNLGAWRAEAALAGRLKLTSLASVLASSLDIDTSSGTDNGVVTMTRRTSIDNDPAVKALILLGDSAIPSIVTELASGNRQGRYRASYALAGIGGPRASEALREHLKTEDDPGVKALTEELLTRL